jgi:hypothetical protein
VSDCDGQCSADIPRLQEELAKAEAECDALKAALAPLMSALNAATPGCRSCMDPERGPVGHEHNNLDCLQILGRMLLSQAEKLREAIGGDY